MLLLFIKLELGSNSMKT